MACIELSMQCGPPVAAFIVGALGLGRFQCNPSRDRLSTIAASGDAVALIPEIRSCRREKAMALGRFLIERDIPKVVTLSESNSGKLPRSPARARS
jgi:hypothetical protein